MFAIKYFAINEKQEFKDAEPKKDILFLSRFFDYYESPQITNILRRKNGADIIVLHQKMLMHTANTDNIYKFWGDNSDADRVAEIAYSLRVKEKVVKEGLEILFKVGLIEHCAEGIYVPFLPDIIDVGKETSDARIDAIIKVDTER